MKGKLVIIENHIISTNTVREKLTATLIEEGYQVTILSTGTTKELNIARNKGFEVIDIGKSNANPWEVLTYIKKLRSALVKLRPDICLTFTIRPAIWGNLVTRQLKIPTITNITGIGPLADSNNYVFIIARWLYKTALRQTSLVFFQNEEDMQVFFDKKFVHKEQVMIIPGSGIDHEKFRPHPKTRKDGKFVFLFISRLIKDKGILEYADAAERLKVLQPGVSCQVLGPYYAQNLKDNIITEKQIMRWLDNGIINYLGAADDVRPFIAEADCIVLPSYREGMSNVLLEASAMQKPCIATDTPGCREIVLNNETGFLCEPKNADSLLEVMVKMANVSEEGRMEMGVKARERVKEKFAKKIVIDAYKHAIEKYKKNKIGSLRVNTAKLLKSNKNF